MKKEVDDETFETALMEMREGSKKQGQALIVAGLEKLKEQFNQRLVYFVSSTMDQLRNLENQKDDLDWAIQLLKDRLQAIHSGKFSISNRGNVRFEEERLNVSIEP